MTWRHTIQAVWQDAMVGGGVGEVHGLPGAAFREGRHHRLVEGGVVVAPVPPAPPAVAPAPAPPRAPARLPSPLPQRRPPPPGRSQPQRGKEDFDALQVCRHGRSGPLCWNCSGPRSWQSTTVHEGGRGRTAGSTVPCSLWRVPRGRRGEGAPAPPAVGAGAAGAAAAPADARPQVAPRAAAPPFLLLRPPPSL